MKYHKLRIAWSVTWGFGSFAGLWDVVEKLLVDRFGLRHESAMWVAHSRRSGALLEDLSGRDAFRPLPDEAGLGLNFEIP
jgi:hypothetical protein